MADETKLDDPAMRRVREIWDRLKGDGWTMQRLGEAMGYEAAHARKSVSQLMRTHNPRIDVLRRFAKAAGVPIEKLVGGK
jgi:transcriptional regulator with XRE-family HTH domain